GTVGSSGSGTGPVSPRRSVMSSRWTPLASTCTRTWPDPGCRSGSSSRTRFSGGPNAWRRIAFTTSWDYFKSTRGQPLELLAVPLGEADGPAVDGELEPPPRRVRRRELREDAGGLVADPVACVVGHESQQQLAHAAAVL